MLLKISSNRHSRPHRTRVANQIDYSTVDSSHLGQTDGNRHCLPKTTVSSLIEIYMRIWLQIFYSVDDRVSEGGNGDDESFGDV